MLPFVDHSCAGLQPLTCTVVASCWTNSSGAIFNGDILSVILFMYVADSVYFLFLSVMIFGFVHSYHLVCSLCVMWAIVINTG
jgi:hypothetical protein